PEGAAPRRCSRPALAPPAARLWSRAHRWSRSGSPPGFGGLAQHDRLGGKLVHSSSRQNQPFTVAPPGVKPSDHAALPGARRSGVFPRSEADLARCWTPMTMTPATAPTPPTTSAAVETFPRVSIDCASDRSEDAQWLPGQRAFRALTRDTKSP